MVKYELISNRALDARAAMVALIDARSLPTRELAAEFPAELADLAYRIADAMHLELQKRARGRR
jgi:hypothetical protein